MRITYNYQHNFPSFFLFYSFQKKLSKFKLYVYIYIPPPQKSIFHNFSFLSAEMDSRLCKNNYQNGQCVVKNCNKFHLRRAGVDTILIDTFAKLSQHVEIKKSKTIPATFPKGIKFHVLNVTGNPMEWVHPIGSGLTKQHHMGVHNILSYDNSSDHLLQEFPDLVEDTKQALAACLDIKDLLYQAFSIDLAKLNQNDDSIPAGATLLSIILNLYSKKAINPSVPLFIYAAEPDQSLHQLLNADSVKNTPIIWRNHNSIRNNYTSSFPDSKANNHFFQINPSSKAHSLHEIKSLIKNDMLSKILATSRAGQRTFQPHDLLHTICNIHQAILDCGIKQELYVTNERLVDNVLRIFPRLLSPSERTGNSGVMSIRATATMTKWKASFEKSPSTSPIPKTIPSLMDTPVQPSLKRSRKAMEELDQPTEDRPAKITRIAIKQDQQVSLNLIIPQEKISQCPQITANPEFNDWLNRQISSYINNYQENKENIAPDSAGQTEEGKSSSTI